MADIKGIEGLSDQEIHALVQQGGKFVYFEYAISVVIMSFKRSSDVFFIRPGESAFVKGLPYSIITMLFGWWGFPWGPIYSVMVLFSNLSGGKDVTGDIVRSA
ncbi:MAG TPA: hypothetical protein QGF58_15055 [Myxococcota bacterium]|nr:hypothetical protein [Myxococcota bacterium]